MPENPAALSAAYLRGLLAIAFVATVLAGAILAGHGGEGEPYLANGQVRCASDTSPVGLWLEAPFGDSGWVEKLPQPGTTAVRFARPVPHGGRYSLHVGCGGTEDDWGMSAISDYYRSEPINIVCNDVPSRFGAVARWIPPVLWRRDMAPYARCQTA